MNKFNLLPSNIFTKLAIFFTNPTNRIIAKQYPYLVEKATIYLNKNTKFRNIFENIKKPTVFIIRDEYGEFIDSFFMPIKGAISLIDEVEEINDVNKRIPEYFLT